MLLKGALPVACLVLVLGCSSNGFRTSLIDPELGNQPYSEADPDEPVDLREGKPVYIWPISSPDGSRILFVSQRDGNTELYTMAIDGSNLVNLTRNSADDGNGSYAWSPDGESVVFSSHRKGNWDIYTVRSDGRKLKRLTGSKSQDYNPVWSPDGKWLAFASNREGAWNIYRMRPDGSGVERLTHGPGSHDAPVYSPDGRWIAFISDRNGNWDIFLMPPDGGKPLLLTPFPSDEDHPRWSSDSQRIIYESDVNGNWDVYSLKTDGSDRVQLTRTPAAESSPVYSPDMSRIAFASYRDGNPEIYVMQADGSDPVRLTFNPGNDICPYWSPDGTRIYFSSNRDGREEIFAIRMEDFREIPVSRTASEEVPEPGVLSGKIYQEEHPGWSSDGKWISFYVRNQTGLIRMRTNVQTGKTEPFPGEGASMGMVKASAYGEHPVWSPDGNSVVFESDQDGNWELYRSDLPAQSTVRLTQSPGADIQPAWSPDGGSIVFTSSRHGDPSLFLMDRQGRNQKSILPGMRGHLPEWTADGEGVYFVQLTARGDTLNQVDIKSRKIKTLVQVEGKEPLKIWHPSASPDGRWVAFISNETGAFRVWLLDPSKQSRRLLNPQGLSSVRVPTRQAAMKSEVLP